MAENQALSSALGTDMTPAPFKEPDYSKLTTMPKVFAEEQRIANDLVLAKGEEKRAEIAQASNLASQQYKASKEIADKAQTYVSDMQKKEAEFPYPEFHPTKDNAQSLAGLFSIVSTLGIALGSSGKQSALNAMGAMTGMMNGWQKGRADLFKQEKEEFDKEFNRIKVLREGLRKDLEDYMKLLPYDKEAAMYKAAEISAKTGADSIIAANVNRGRPEVSLQIVRDMGKAIQHKEDKDAEERRHRETIAAADRRNRESIAARERIASLRNVGSRSATSERYAGNVFRSANEVNRSLELIEQIGVSTGGGALGQVVGKGTIPSEIQKYLGQAFTDEQERNYNTAMSGVALEMAYVLGGGYKPDVGLQNKLETYLSVGPNDTAGTAAYKFSDTVAKLKAAIESSPTYNDTQKETKDILLKKFDKYATPEVVYQRAYGIAPRTEPMIRSGESNQNQSSGEWTVKEKP